MKKECIFYQMWSKQIQATQEEKAEVYLSIGAELRDDLLMSINISANNRVFLMELDRIILKGYNYCDMWLRGLLSDYVKRRSMEDNDSSYQIEYYTSWLNNTILILNGNYPVIKEWCEEYKTWVNQYYKDLSDGHVECNTEQSEELSKKYVNPCAEDSIPCEVSKDKEEIKYTPELLMLFHDNKGLISKLVGKSDNEIAALIKKWAGKKDKFGKPLIENPDNNLKTAFAEALKENRIIKLSVRSFRDKL